MDISTNEELKMSGKTNPYAVVGQFDLSHTPGKTPAEKLTQIVHDLGGGLSATFCSRGLYRHNPQGGKDSAPTVACRPPHGEDKTGTILNVYEATLLAELKEKYSCEK
jgi:hypothetical protein